MNRGIASLGSMYAVNAICEPLMFSSMFSAESMITIDKILANFPLTEFVEQYLHRLPYALPNAAEPICYWGTWETFAAVWSAPEADIMVVRANEQYAGELLKDSAALLSLSREGYTVLARHVERHHEGIAQLAALFAETFRGPVDVHVYVTPPNQYGFSWHYDAEDVFILQLTGEKEYHLRKNTVNPWPLAETLPEDMQYERELMPLMQVKLCASDLLYIPGGYWHRAFTSESSETAFSLAVGILPRTAIDVFDLLRPQLVESLLWRQRLPVKGNQEDDPRDAAAYQMLLEMLAADLSKTLTSSQFKAIVMQWNKP